MYNYISNYKGRTDLVDLYGDNSLLLYALQSLIVKVVVSKNLYSCFDRLSDIVLYLT